MKNRQIAGVATLGFDKVNVLKNVGGTVTKVPVNDISRFNGNSEARYKQDVVIEVSNNYPAAHIVGKLTDGLYVGGGLKQESIVYQATLVVIEPFDKPVKISVGTIDAPSKFATDFDCTQARGTITITQDCNTFIDLNDDVIVTVAGTADGVAGRVAVILEVSKLGASTLMPSN